MPAAPLPETDAMTSLRPLALAFVLASAALAPTAEAGSYGCSDSDKVAMNHNAQDPTQPGTIGGCGTGQHKYEKYKKHRQRLQNQNILQGPSRLGTGQNF